MELIHIVAVVVEDRVLRACIAQSDAVDTFIMLSQVTIPVALNDNVLGHAVFVYSVMKEEGALGLSRDIRHVIAHSKMHADLWMLPGGYVEAGETLEEAFVREIKGETGFIARADRFLASYPLTKRGRHIIFIVFLTRAISGELSLGDDVDNVVALPPREVLETLTGRLARRAVRSWIERKLELNSLDPRTDA